MNRERKYNHLAVNSILHICNMHFNRDPKHKKFYLNQKLVTDRSTLHKSLPETNYRHIGNSVCLLRNGHTNKLVLKYLAYKFYHRLDKQESPRKYLTGELWEPPQAQPRCFDTISEWKDATVSQA